MLDERDEHDNILELAFESLFFLQGSAHADVLGVRVPDSAGNFGYLVYPPAGAVSPFWIVDFFRDDEYSVSPNVTAAIFLIGLIVFLIWLSICFVRFIYRRYLKNIFCTQAHSIQKIL